MSFTAVTHPWAGSTVPATSFAIHFRAIDSLFFLMCEAVYAKRDRGCRSGGRERRMTKWFISLGLLGVLVLKKGTYNQIMPLKTPQTPSLDSPAVCTTTFISLFHQYTLSSKWNFMAAVRRMAPQLDWITFSKRPLLCSPSLSLIPGLSVRCER